MNTPTDIPLAGLYRTVVMEHARNREHRRAVDAANRGAEGRNTQCGDEVRFSLRECAGRVEAVGFDGHGCALCMASASMLSGLVEGRTVDEACRLLDAAHHYLKGERDGIDPGTLGDLPALEGVSRFPVRIKCALLPVLVARDALAVA